MQRKSPSSTTLTCSLSLSCLSPNGSALHTQAGQLAGLSGIEGGSEAAHPSHHSGQQLHVLVVDSTKRRLGIVLDQPLHPTRRFLIGEAGHHIQRHIDACRDPGRIDDVAIDRPALLDVVRAQVLQEARIGPVGGDVTSLQQPDGGQNRW